MGPVKSETVSLLLVGAISTVIGEVKSETSVARRAQEACVPEPRAPIPPRAMRLYEQRRLCWPLLRLLSQLRLARLYQPCSQRVSSLL
jgi:hypothetical protein